MKVGDLIWLGQQLADAGRAEIRANAPDVPTAELIVMGDLLDSPPSTITAIAERTGYAQSRVSTAVAGIVERGWAKTGSDPTDGRRTVVFIPEEMRVEARKYQGQSQARALDRLLLALPPHRRETMTAALEELLAALRQQDVDDHAGTTAGLHRGLEPQSDRLPTPRRSSGGARPRR
jgi:MarR family transcriptional regulator, 2-MHQ and catechol-resistance regulon repressor